MDCKDSKLKDIDKIVVFDGVCNLCNRLVIFIIKKDPKAKISFASYQSPAGEKILKKYSIKYSGYGSIVYLSSGVAYTKSRAILRIFKDIGSFWKLLYLFIIIPRPIRDWIYDKIAQNRYRLFGKEASCLVPSEKIKDRFIL